VSRFRVAYTERAVESQERVSLTAQEAGLRGAMPLGARTCGEAAEARHCLSLIDGRSR
jgi:hypothetical protein